MQKQGGKMVGKMFLKISTKSVQIAFRLPSR